MPIVERDRAQQLLSSFVGRTMSSTECGEFELRLIFEDKSEFVTRSPWRLTLRGDLLTGSGDSKERALAEILRHLIGLRVVSTHISDCGDTQLLFEEEHVVEAVSDSVQYETWEAHLKIGWVIFSAGGGVTVFPPAATPEVRPPLRHSD
jgi:hypothetical protein